MSEQRVNVVANGPLGVSFGPIWPAHSIAVSVTYGPKAVDGLRFTVDGQTRFLMVRDQVLAPIVHRGP